MHPVLFEIPILGGIKVHSYGLMMALGFLASLAWIRFQAPRVQLPAKKMMDFAFLMIISAIVGSRLVFIFVEWRYYAKHPLDIFKVWEGGLVFFGGLVACMIVAWHYLKKHRFSFWPVSDLFMPAVALGHAVGRLGCFAAGCCHGRQCDPRAWYAVVFPNKVGTLAPPGVPLYPTQLMEAGAEFLMFAYLAWKSQKKAFDGQIFLLYLIIYSVIRISIELFRGDLERGFVIPGIISTSQFIGLVLIIFAIIVLIFRTGRSP